MISRLLIANRGEIAVRIARTAHRLGIDTVGVYSETDRNALHTDVVDIAVSLGGATPAASYLRVDAVIEAALATGADAVHPGYGFLAENADAAAKVIDAGLVWVGPTPDQIRLLGDKVAAKRAALEAGVATSPIVEVVDGAPSGQVPLPALVKAAAGGGGRGMRIVLSEADVADAIAAASREAESAFGDGTVFLEPFIERGRHIEVQIIGDAHGNVVHLGERECSIQRRNQKIVEESPSAGIDADVRRSLCDGAIALARHVGYQNAGTVEYLVGGDGTIDFLEVNTRLQVEHPVTEAVTGIDLVELQLHVAAGAALPITQDDISFDGHAIEVRLVAEDPAAGWLPASGEILAFDIDPASVAGSIRIDTGVRAGAQVTPDYDSMIAKVIVQAPSRTAAAKRLSRALRASQIAGVATNLDALVAILVAPDFLAARTPTTFLDDHPELLTSAGPSGDDLLALLVGAVFARERADRAADAVTGFAPSGWRNLRTRGQRQTWLSADGDHAIEYTLTGPEQADVLIGPWPAPTDDGSLGPDDRRPVVVRLLERTAARQVVELDGRRYVVETTVDGDSVHTRGRAGARTFALAPRFDQHETELAGSGPLCPLPGTVIALHVEAGQAVVDGQLLVVVEAMKMEHQITVVGDGVVTEVHFALGDRVDAGELLVSVDASQSSTEGSPR